MVSNGVVRRSRSCSGVRKESQLHVTRSAGLIPAADLTIAFPLMSGLTVFHPPSTHSWPLPYNSGSHSGLRSATDPSWCRSGLGR